MSPVPPPATRILIISSRQNVSDALAKLVLHAPDLALIGHINRPLEALSDSARIVGVPDIVILDKEGAGTDPLSLIPRLMARFANAAVMVASAVDDVGEVERILLSGARGVLPLPLEEGRAVGLLRQIHSLEFLRRSYAPFQSQGKVLAIAGLKGGVGRTLIAVNLSIALRQASGQPVALVSGDWADDDVALMLNLHPNHTVADLLGRRMELDAELVLGVMMDHTSGIRVLAAPPTPDVDMADLPGTLTVIFSELRQRFAYIVLDTGVTLDLPTVAMLDLADHIYIGATPEMPALQQAARLLDTAKSWDYPDDKMSLILNCTPSAGGIPEEEIRNYFKVPVDAIVPSDGAVMNYTVNRGIPIILSHPKSPASQALTKLAQTIVSHEQPAQQLPAPTGDPRMPKAPGIGRIGDMFKPRRTATN